MTDNVTDIETRLRADAAREARLPVPDFDAALDRVVGVARAESTFELDLEPAPAPTPTRSTGRRLAPWLAAAAAVALAAGVVALTTHDELPDRPTRPAAPTNVPATRGDTVLRYQDKAGFDAVARAAGDAKSLDVVVPYDTADGGCSLFEPRVEVVSQTDDEVVLNASGYRYVERSGDGSSCSNLGSGTEVLLRVHLDAPLGDRTVYDDSLGGGTDAVVGVIDPTAIPTPSYVPAGYSEFSRDRVDLEAGSFGAGRDYASADNKLAVTGGPSNTLMVSDSDRKADVNGHRADFDSHNGCLYWMPRPGYTYGICVDGPGKLSQDEMLRVARSID